MSKMYGILNGKNCFITGATGGLGRIVAMKMAESGCNLFLTATNASNLKKLENRLRGRCGKNIKIACEQGDLNNAWDIKDIIRKAIERFRSIDILINCAGIFPVKFLEDSELEDFETCFNVNVRAPFLFAKAFSQGMKKRRWGRIVNIGSSSAYSGVRETSIYCSSKHALLGLSRSLFDELKGYGIRTFCISPSGLKTEMGRKIRRQNFNTFLDPEEVAEYINFVILFNKELISEELRLNRIAV